jgi:hypothetical protein
MPEQIHVAAGIPNGFNVSASGVYFTKKAETEDEDGKPFRVCSKLEVAALVQTKDSDEWGLELTWNDMSNSPCTWILPRNLLHIRMESSNRPTIVGKSSGFKACWR